MGSHDFIKFPPRLVPISPKTFMLMGEIQVCIEQLLRLPIPPEQSMELRKIYLTKGVQGTTAIEGSTLTEKEVRAIIEEKLTLPPSREYMQREVENVVNAINDVGRRALLGSDEDFSPETLHSWHRMILGGLDDVLDESVAIGKFRQHNVVVGRYVGAPPADCARMVSELCDWLNNDQVAPSGQERYTLAWQVVKAIVAHVNLALIHPYGDGNGRLSRLVEFAILLRVRVPDIAAHLLSNFYNATRTRYRRELQNMHGEFVDGSYPPDIKWQGFLEYALEGYRDYLLEQYKEICGMLQSVIWHDFIHRAFPKQMTVQQQRRKQLALSMTELDRDRAVLAGEVRELSPALTAAYITVSDRTIDRDLKALVSMGLLNRTFTGYKSNSDVLFAFFANVRPRAE